LTLKTKLTGLILTAFFIITIFSAGISNADDSVSDINWDDASASEIHQKLAETKAAALADKNLARQMTLQEVQADFQMNYDVLFYDVWIRINDTNRILYGDVKFVAKATENGVNEIDIDFHVDMDVDSIVAPSGQLAYFRSNNITTVTLDGSYDTDEQFEFNFYYHGHPVEGGFQAFSFSTWDANTIISSLSEPYYARTWWPCKDRMDDKPDSMDIALAVDTSFYAVSNGTLDSTVEGGDNVHTFYYTVRYPITTYLFSVAISNYTVWEDEWTYNNDEDTMLLVHAVFPSNYDSSLVKYDITPYALTVYSENYGLYPFTEEKYGHAQFQWGGAMEHQTISSMNGGSFGMSEPVVVHEMSHQWWGDMITCESWSDIWLNEGWASYSEALYYLEKNGWQSYINYMNSMAYEGGGTIYVYDTTNVWNIFHGGLSYDKGAWVVHMLRGLLGETKFFQAIEAYYNSEYKFGAADTEKFRDVFENASGMELDWFFEDWIYGTYRPNYEWSYWVEPSPTSGYDVYLYVNQLQTTDPQIFRMPVDFAFQFNSDPDDTVRLALDQRENWFKLNFPDNVNQVILDPMGWVLKYQSKLNWSLHIITRPDDLVDGERFQSYSQQIEVRGGSGEYIFSITAGSLPDGFTLDENGLISGVSGETGTFAFTVKAKDIYSSYNDVVEYSLNIEYAPSNKPGDANDDNKTNISDITMLVAYLFDSGLYLPAPNQGDVNHSCTLNISDITYMVAYLFGSPSGPVPQMGCVE